MDWTKPDRSPEQIEWMMRKASPVPTVLQWACHKSLGWGYWQDGVLRDSFAVGDERLSLFPTSRPRRSTP